MRLGTDMRAGGVASSRNMLLLVIATASVAIAVMLFVRIGAGPEQAAADGLNAPPAAPASGGFIKIGDIKGESKDSAHQDWINVESVSHGITRPMGAGISGSTRQRGSVTMGDVVVVKELDKSSPKLQEALATGQVIPEVFLDFAADSAIGGRDPYLQYELKNVLVTNYRISGAVSGSDRPTETFSLNFEEIKVTYNELSLDGSSRGKIEYSWKVEEGTR